MSISLSTLTNPATSDSVLLEAQSEADFLEPIVLFKNRATGSNAISNDATQTTANDQPLSLPLIKNPSGNLGGYLYIPNVSGNYATGPSVTIGANETWEGEVDMMVTDFGPSSNYLLPMGGGEWLSGFGLIIYHDGDVRPWSKGAVGGTEQPSGVALNTPFNAKYGFDGTNLYVDIDDVRVFTGTASTEQSNSITHPLELNQQTLTQQGDYAIQKAKLTVNSAVVFDCDFNGSTSIEDGATSFEATTGGTVTINRGSGVDQARIVRRPKAVFNNSEMDFVHTNVGDAFFVCATESGVVSGVFNTGVGRNKFSGNGALKTSYRTDFLQTLWGMWPNTISDSQKKALVDYAKSKSAGKNWAGIENFVSFFRGSNLKSLNASYWDTVSGTSFAAFARGSQSLESLDIRGWDTSSVVNMTNFAWDCTSLTNISIDGNTLSDSACTNYGNAFTNTNLNQATIDDILVRINAAGTSNGTFDRTGGEYPSTTGVAAKNALQARGWSMTFSSEVLPSVLDLEPAAAYSLRALKSSQDPNVVRVRRSSDGALSNFKASEVTDGTLTTWVNTEYNRYTSDFSSGVDGWAAFSGTTMSNVDSIGGRDDCLKFTIDTSSSWHFVFRGGLITNGFNQRISFEVYIPSTNTVLDEVEMRQGNTAFTPTSGTNKTSVKDQWVTISFEFDFPVQSRFDIAANSSTSNSYQGNGTDTFYVRNIQIDQLTADGHVTTWYDQGGTNHASQPLVSNMPLLVDGGTLVTEGGKPAVDFDGVNSFVNLQHSDLYGQSVLDSYYVTSTTDDMYLYPATGGSSPYGMVAQVLGGGSTSSYYGSPDFYANGSQITGATRGTIYTATSGGQKLVAHLGADTSNSGWSNMIFGLYTSTSVFAYDGKLQEMIFFNTDQSANRIAIENNINSHFTIYS